eukprot:GHRR01011308.1.p1 GENE.GHRR01011308.1~~GHRR01011308.1.p1  ORF type:complete len:249 (+),score=85.90 GHRR01011308.1:959-1705(+)
MALCSLQGRGVAAVLRRQVLPAAAASSSGLTVTAQVFAACLVLCAMLESSHAVSLTAVMSTELWPSIEGSLRRHVKRLTDELRMAATEEVNSLLLTSVDANSGADTAPRPVQVPASGLVVCSSLVREMAGLATLLAPIIIGTPKLVATLKKTLIDMFTAVTQTASFTLRSHIEGLSEGGAPAAADLARLLPAIMEVLAGLVDDQLAEALAPLTVQAGPILDVKAMDKALNAMYRECQDATQAVRTPTA